MSDRKTMKVAEPDRRISQQLRQIADELDKRLEETAGEHKLFSLVVFQSEPGSRMNYISNARREDVIHAMQSLLQGWNAGMPDIPAHEIQG